jgi:spermidine/putrescine transport system substrate-binding protein
MISRRSLLLAGGAGLLVSTLAACAPTRSSPSSGGSATPGAITGTIRMANYEGWMGENQVSGFTKRYPGTDVTQGTLPDGAWVEYLRQNEGAYDFALGGGASVFQLNASDMLHTVTQAEVPNLANIPQRFLDAVPGAMPLEQGKFGIAYSKSRVKNPPTSWAEFFDRAKEWSGRLVLPSHNGSAFGPALLALGIDANTIDEAEYTKGRDLVVGVKPYVKTFTESGVPGLMTDGSTDMLMAYDYDFATAAAESDDVGWINPEEGTTGYIDAWMAFKDSQNLETVLAFMDYSLEPEVYGDFINTTYASYIMPSAEKYISDEITSDPALAFSDDLNVVYGDAATSIEREQLASAAYQYLQNA